MDPSKASFPLGLTFDDVLLLPGYVQFSRSEIDLTTKFTQNITLTIPLVSAPMDTVTESELAIALASQGGLGVIHRNLAIVDQAKEVAKVKKTRSASSGQVLLVGAAVGAGGRYQERVTALVKAGVDVVIVDSAHGYARPIVDATKWIKRSYKDLDVVPGNIATYEGAKALIAAGADGLRVGMGAGAICTTRIISGMGVPQVTAIRETVRAAKKKNIPVCADGGIKYSGDMVKALSSGASTCMMGNFFASTAEAPGKIVELKREQVPHRFLSIFDKSQGKVRFKEYRGMGSVGAMEKGAKIKSEGEFHGKSYKDRILVAEGVEGLVPIKGTVKELVDQAMGGIKSGFYYIGARSIKELWRKARFIQISQASLTESHPHSILITNPGENY